MCICLCFGFTVVTRLTVMFNSKVSSFHYFTTPKAKQLSLKKWNFLVVLRCFTNNWHWLYTLQGFNGTLTEPVEKTGDQIKEMELKVHPELRQPLTALCSDPNTTVVVLSGSGRKVLDDVILVTLLIFSVNYYMNPLINVFL